MVTRPEEDSGSDCPVGDVCWTDWSSSRNPGAARSSRCGSGSRPMRNQGQIGPIEWATARRPLPGEKVCGDYAIAVDVAGGAALFGVADGLGHGAAAETADRKSDV